MVRFRSWSGQGLLPFPGPGLPTPPPRVTKPLPADRGCVDLDGQKDLGLGLLNGSGGSGWEATGPLEELQAPG